MRIVILGHSITSSWGNSHAVAYRCLARELSGLGHEVLFLERDLLQHAKNRDMPRPPSCRACLYGSVAELRERFFDDIRTADCVIVGSYVPEGAKVGELITSAASGVTVFYDLDAPVTLARLKEGRCGYLNRKLVRNYSIYISSTSGPILERFERELGSPMARPLYCPADTENYYPEAVTDRRIWDMGYMGTYSSDRQKPLEELMLRAARKLKTRTFVVAGPQYPEDITWPVNLQRLEYLPQDMHRRFYNCQKFTLNITRADMKKAGYSPPMRLFEAAACGTPIISDLWEGLSEIFEPGREILISRSAEETMDYLLYTPERERVKLGIKARERVLGFHTAAHRAKELENYINEVSGAARLPKAG